MWKPFGLMLTALKSYGHYIEHAFHASVGRSLAASEVSACGLDDVRLLGTVHIVLWRRLYAEAAGLDLYKMYSISSNGDNVDFQMSAPPVPLKDLMSQTLQKCACDILALFS